MTTSENYKFKSYQTLLEEALTDESMAGDIYRYMANISPDASSAERLRKIAADEDRHHLIVSHLLAELSGQGETGYQYTERMEQMLGHRHPSQMSTREGKTWPEELAWREKTFGELHRPFPETTGDWEDLGYDIEAKIPSIDRAEVRHHVAVATSNEPGNIDMAKHWLIQKAGELGIT